MATQSGLAILVLRGLETKVRKSELRNRWPIVLQVDWVTWVICHCSVVNQQVPELEVQDEVVALEAAVL